MRATRAVRRRVVSVSVAAVVAPVAFAVTACGSASEPSPPTGVDGLVVPTPDPDPADFVDVVDNPWLPLSQGARWDYRVTDDYGQHRVVTTVVRGPVVAGVPTTSVERVTSGRAAVEGTVVDHYAQDTDGNVWWLGREGEWSAGEDGAEAGLAMPAEPRFGDGFLEAVALGVDVRARVASVDASAEPPAGEFTDVLVLQVTSGGGEGVEREEYYAEGVGLVLAETPGLGTTTGLVAYDEPR
jgi:hypothetical protein